MNKRFEAFKALHTPPLSVQDVVTLTGWSARTVIRRFEHEPGVLILSRPEQVHKRRYRTFRIPRAVFERVKGRGKLC